VVVSWRSWKNTHIPISSARAVRSSMDGLDVLAFSFFGSSGWGGSGRVRLGRDRVVEAAA
jgi:hypothetical protein